MVFALKPAGKFMPRAPSVSTDISFQELTKPQTPSQSGAGDIPPVFLRLPALMRVTRLGRSTIYRLVADGTFPKPVQLAPRAVAWRRADIDDWTAAGPSLHISPKFRESPSEFPLRHKYLA